jgi:S1-C subfamily serine protease
MPANLIGRRAASCAVAVLACSLSAGEALAQGAKRHTVPSLAREVSPAVVFIGAVGADGTVQSIGSGFVVDPSGIIVTNYHVIEGAEDAQIRMADGEIYERVQVIDYDTRRDIAVLRIRAFRPLPSLTLGSSDGVEVGEDAVAIGNPQGLTHTVTAGVVSAFRQAEGYRLIQISVPISPGSSGGPLFNMQGEVIGITTSGLVGEGTQNLNFAVPIEYARPLISGSGTMSVGDLARKMSARPPASAAPAAARGQATQQQREEVVAAWRVAHDHGDGTFKDVCLGTLYITPTKVGYTNDSRIHVWEASLTAVARAQKNALVGADLGAFHVRLITGSNYNFVALNDQLQYVNPDQVLLSLVEALQRAKQQ